MIPVLFDAAASTFKTNGLGRLSSAKSCKVTEERNGQFELEMDYPISGEHYGDIALSRIICAVPADGKDPQPFRIYQISKPLNGVVTVYARHISYRLSLIPAVPTDETASSAEGALKLLKANAAEECPFSFESDVTTEGTYTIDTPASIRSQLGGTSGSVLDVYGGEYEWDNWTVRLHKARGYDTGIVLRYGKNITDIKQEESIESTVTGVLPFWRQEGEDGVTQVLGDMVYSDNADKYPFHMTMVLDLSQEYESAPTKEQLEERAEKYIENNDIGVPDVNISVSFIALWQTEDYKDIACLERVNLCDQIEVEFPTLGVSATAKVIKTVYNVLLERYESIEIGSARTNLSDVIAANKQNIESSQKKTTSFMQKAISYATKLIQGGLGGHVVMNVNAAGQPNEILIMDTDDIATAVNVIRMNVNGIGFSKNGYNGPFTTAWTIDGAFNADFIVSGTMQADRIKGGVLTLGGEDDVNGELMVLNADGDIVGIWDKDGIFIYAGAITGSDVIVGGTSDASLQVVNNSDQLETLIDKNGMKIYYKGTEIGKIWSTYDTDTGKRGVSYALSEKGYYLSFGYYNTESGGLNAHTRYFRDASIAGEYGWYYFSPLHLVNRAIKFVDSTESGKTMAQISNLKMSDTEEGLSFNVCTDNAKYIGFGYYADGDATFTSRTQYYAPDSELVTEEGWYANCAVHLLNALIFAEKGKYDEYNAKVSRMNLTSDGVTYKGIKVEAGCLYIDTTKLRVTSDGSSFSTGYTGTVTISGKTLTYVNGILTKVSG